MSSVYSPGRSIVAAHNYGRLEAVKGATKQMGRIVAKLLVGMAITAIAILAADTTVGTWKLNPAKSKSTTLKSRTDVREETPDGGIKVTRTEQSGAGVSSDSTFTYKYDGKEYPATGGQFDTLSVKRINANANSWEAKKAGGKFHETGRVVVSKDGKTLTQTFKGTDADGKQVHGANVYDRQ
jgi:hypothetical protein